MVCHGQDESEEIVALELGADDYPAEKSARLLARIRAALRSKKWDESREREAKSEEAIILVNGGFDHGRQGKPICKAVSLI